MYNGSQFIAFFRLPSTADRAQFAVRPLTIALCCVLVLRFVEICFVGGVRTDAFDTDCQVQPYETHSVPTIETGWYNESGLFYNESYFSLKYEQCFQNDTTFDSGQRYASSLLRGERLLIHTHVLCRLAYNCSTLPLEACSGLASGIFCTPCKFASGIEFSSSSCNVCVLTTCHRPQLAQ